MPCKSRNAREGPAALRKRAPRHPNQPWRKDRNGVENLDLQPTTGDKESFMATRLSTNIRWAHLIVKITLMMTGASPDDDVVQLNQFEQVLDLIVLAVELTGKNPDNGQDGSEDPPNDEKAK